ncbi:MAG: 50S ribosomal protein L17 [bacterium]
MRHLKKGRKLKRTSSHKDALMRSLATSLLQHKRIATTEAKAKELRPYAEQIITRAKRAVLKEQQGLLAEGQTIDVHSRRIVYKDIKDKAVVQELFDTIAPLVAERPGGYTRIIKTGTRRGDGSRTAVIELVDWSAPQDGAVDFKSKKKRKSKKPAKIKVKKEKAESAISEEEIIEEAEVEETVQVDEAAEVTEDVASENPDEDVAETTEIIDEAPATEEVVEENPLSVEIPENPDEEKNA